MDDEIEKVAKSCEACLEAKQAPAKAPLQPWTWPSKPWQRIHIDYAGPFMGKSFLLAIDAHSKWGEVFEMSSTTTSKTIETLRQLFAAYGLPHQLVSDNGPQFTSDEFAVFLRRNGVKHTRCTPYHPSSNGEAERFVRTFKQAMKAGRHDGLPLSHRLQSFLLTYRSTPHSTTNRAPCELFLGRKIRTRLDLLRSSVEEHVLQQQARQKDQHDWHTRHRTFEEGQKVMVKGRRPGSASWIPGKINHKTGPLTYVVDMENGSAWRCHVDQMKACLETELSLPTSQSDCGDEEWSLAPGEVECGPEDYEESASEQDSEESNIEPDESASDSDSMEVSGTSDHEESRSTADHEVSGEASMEPAANIPLATKHKYPLRDRAKHRRFT